MLPLIISRGLQALLIISLCHSATAAAAAPGTAERELTPYTAKYRTTARGMALTLTRKLEQNADGSYTLTNGGKIMVAGFHEMSVFSVDGLSVLPKSYV